MLKIHSVSCATLCPWPARLVNGEGPLLGRGRLVCHCWLVEGPDGLILVDTGLGEADLREPRQRLGAWFSALVHPVRDPAQTALAAVRRLGFRPEDVRHIVPTHLDLDHAGGLPDFPNAVVHVHARELQAALHPPTVKERARYRAAHFRHGPRWAPCEAGGERWFGFEAVRALPGVADEVLLVPLFGHTRGHCGVAVRGRQGWQLHAGDAYFFHRELEEPPTCTAGLRLFQRVVVTDNAQRLENQRRLRALVAEHGREVRVNSAHCPVEFDRLVG